MSKTVKFVLFFLLILLFAIAIPDPPIITHLEIGSSFIRVSWKAPLNSVRKPVIGYLVQAVDDNNPNNGINCSDVANNSCTIYGLKPDTSYQVRVQATNAVGYGFSAYEKVVTKDEDDAFVVLSLLCILCCVIASGLLLIA